MVHTVVPSTRWLLQWHKKQEARSKTRLCLFLHSFIVKPLHNQRIFKRNDGACKHSIIIDKRDKFKVVASIRANAREFSTTFFRLEMETHMHTATSQWLNKKWCEYKYRFSISVWVCWHFADFIAFSLLLLLQRNKWQYAFKGVKNRHKSKRKCGHILKWMKST